MGDVRRLEEKMVKVICEMMDYASYIHKPEDGEAYQHQCGNDEIEVGHQDNFARCYTYEKENDKIEEEK